MLQLAGTKEEKGNRGPRLTPQGGSSYRSQASVTRCQLGAAVASLHFCTAREGRWATPLLVAFE
jgi:hypothetical protein